MKQAIKRMKTKVNKEWGNEDINTGKEKMSSRWIEYFNDLTLHTIGRVR